MGLIHYVSGEEIERSMKEIQPGFKAAEMLSNAMHDIVTSKCCLQANFSCVLKSSTDVATSIFFIRGSGIINVGRKTFVLTERAVFCPDLANSQFEIFAESEIEFLFFQQKMTEEDKKHFEMYHIVLPWFNSFSNWHLYTEGFRNEDLRTYACLHQYYVSRMSIGEVVGSGNAKLDPHKHPELFQWFYGLPGTDPFLFKAEGDEINVKEGDWICIPNEVFHIVSPKNDNAHIDYVWFEVVVQGREMCPYFY